MRAFHTPVDHFGDLMMWPLFVGFADADENPVLSVSRGRWFYGYWGARSSETNANPDCHRPGRDVQTGMFRNEHSGESTYIGDVEEAWDEWDDREDCSELPSGELSPLPRWQARCRHGGYSRLCLSFALLGLFVYLANHAAEIVLESLNEI